MKVFLATLFFVSSFPFFASSTMEHHHYKIVPKETKVKWTGRKVGGQHWGYVPVKRGELHFHGDHLVSGMAMMDMAALNVGDIKNPKKNESLVNHLKSGDFFDTTKHPTAVFAMNSVRPRGGGKFHITADFTLKGIKKTVSFEASVGSPKGEVRGTASFVFNRTDFGITYKSKSFFKSLKDKFIYDDVSIEITFLARKATTK